MKARKERRKLVGVSTLTAHASVNFKMNGKGSNADCARSTFKLVERMSALRFPDADPLTQSAFRARDAVEKLYQIASELERKA